MTVYTGCYYNPDIHNYGKLVRISRSVPDFLSERIDIVLPELFPSWDLVNRYKGGNITFGEYTDIYIHTVLAKLDPVRVIEKLADGDIMLCHCSGRCHRQIVGAWIEMLTDVKCVEVV